MGVGVSVGVGVAVGITVGVGDGVGVGVATASVEIDVKNANEYTLPATKMSGVLPVVHEMVLPTTVPGPETVFQPAAAFPGSNIATYEAAVGTVAPAGNVMEKAGVGIVTVTSGISVEKPNVEMLAPPIERGARRIAATAGVPAGCPSEKTRLRCETTFVGGTAVEPVLPGPIGPRTSEVDCVVLVVSAPLAVAGFGLAVGVGVGPGPGGGDEEPPLQALTSAARATAVSERRSIRQSS